MPIHPRIKGINPINNHSYDALAKAFLDAKPGSLPKELHLTSLMLRFLDELEVGGLSKDVLFMVANGSKREHWTGEVLKELSSSIKRLHYSFE